MGTDYTINLFFPIENVQQALEAIIPHTVHFDNKTTVKLVDGKKITVPYAASLKQNNNERIDLGSEEYHMLALSMLFPYDKQLEEYENRILGNISASGKSSGEIIRNKSGRCQVGYIYLSIRLGKKFVEFSFLVATSRMNILFQNSDSVHKVFRDILNNGGGIYAHINFDSVYEYIPLEHPKLYLAPYDEKQSTEMNDVDRLVLASLKILEYQRKHWVKQGDAEAFYKKWVEPFRDIIQWGETPNISKLQQAFVTVEPYLGEIEAKVFDLLFEDTHPLYFDAAVWLVGLTKNRNYLPYIENLATKSWFLEMSKYSYSFALAQLGEAIPDTIPNMKILWNKTEIESVIAEFQKLLKAPS